MPSSVAQAGIPSFQVIDARAQQIKQCEVAALTALGLLGPAHALLVGGTGTAGFVVSLFLTGAQACAVFSIISAIFVVRELEKDADLDPFVVRIPIACCSIAGALLVIATCIVHWKAACGIAVLAIVFLVVVHRGTVVALGGRLVHLGAMLLNRVSNTLLKFGGWLVNQSAMLLTGVGNSALAFGRWLALSHLRAPPEGGSDLEMGVESGGGEQAA